MREVELGISRTRHTPGCGKAPGGLFHCRRRDAIASRVRWRSAPRALGEPALRFVLAPMVSALRWLRGWGRRLFFRWRWNRLRILARLWLAIGAPRSRWFRRFLRSLTAHPRLALRTRRILPLPSLLPHRRVALLFGVDEFLPRIAMIPAWSPITAARAASSLGSARSFR